MANQIATVNGIAIASIANINGITDANLAKWNGREFTGTLPDAHTLIATATASASATLSFTTGIDSTYDAYEFRYENIHPATDQIHFGFQVNAAGASGFNETITSTFFEAYHQESDSGAALHYDAGYDLAQGTAYQTLARSQSNGADAAASGILTLYNPSSTTFVKHFVSRAQGMHGDGGVAAQAYVLDQFAAGYINVTAAIDEISFKYSSGNIDAGQIKMYGIAKA
jgi:hypothetical protein